MSSLLNTNNAVPVTTRLTPFIAQKLAAMACRNSRTMAGELRHLIVEAIASKMEAEAQ